MYSVQDHPSESVLGRVSCKLPSSAKAWKAAVASSVLSSNQGRVWPWLESSGAIAFTLQKSRVGQAKRAEEEELLIQPGLLLASQPYCKLAEGKPPYSYSQAYSSNVSQLGLLQ